MKLKDSRPVAEQVKSGLRIAGALVLSITVIVLFVKGYHLSIHSVDRQDMVEGSLLLGALAVLLTATVQYWRLWFPGLPAYLGMRLMFGFYFGWFMPDVSGLWAIIFSPLMFAMVFLSLRFSQKNYRMSLADRIVLLIALLCLFLTITSLLVSGLVKTTLFYTGVGDGVLLLSWLHWKWYSHSRRRHHSRPALQQN